MFFINQKLKSNKSFTLIELLIVIAILSLLMAIVVISINPAEMLKKSRDAKRISSIKNLNNALSIFQATRYTGFMGTSSIVYISIPDSDSSCSNLGLPTLPDGYTYACATSANYRKTDGTGWIPVNFDSLDIGSPISSLPIDPTNTTSTGLYFTYVAGGSWELTSGFESVSYNEQAVNDGGTDPLAFEFGTNLTLSTFAHGLVGSWNFNETGTVAIDSSVSGVNADIYSSATLTDLHTSTNCKSGSCLLFDGIDDMATSTAVTVVDKGNSRTISFWFLTETLGSPQIGLMSVAPTWNYGSPLWLIVKDASDKLSIYQNGYHAGSTTITANQWHHVAYTYNKLNNAVGLYLNGNSEYSGTLPETGTSTRMYFGAGYNARLDGQLDNVRIYNRVLSASEVLALYNYGQ